MGNQTKWDIHQTKWDITKMGKQANRMIQRYLDF